ncbi:hypothetical protein NDU88_001687 [Pleurodeles waltl]|uniref:Uncharacterized protein n=1 Tax=Pleurodeles waltl TaxID=8319 RepID=A0AAV7TJE2_PLEWA|nr:hypothetical protein NDU88_001687 [Pleurodeles waltl]
MKPRCVSSGPTDFQSQNNGEQRSRGECIRQRSSRTPQGGHCTRGVCAAGKKKKQTMQCVIVRRNATLRTAATHQVVLVPGADATAHERDNSPYEALEVIRERPITDHVLQMTTAVSARVFISQRR